MKTWLDVPYKDKDLVKRLGAQWDDSARRWWVPINASQELFRQWIPARMTYNEWVDMKCREAKTFWNTHGNPAMGEALEIFWRSDSSHTVAQRDGVDIATARQDMARQTRELFADAAEAIELRGLAITKTNPVSAPLVVGAPAWL